MKTKVCSKCGKRKKLSEFYKDKKLTDGYSYECKDCANFRSKMWRLKNKQKEQKYNSEYYLKHQEELKARAKKYAEENENYRKQYLRKTSGGFVWRYKDE